MIYPPATATLDELKTWVNSVAPYREPCHQELHADMRYLAGIRDRELAAISAQGIVSLLRKQRKIV